MRLPWQTIGRIAAKAVHWIAPRVGKSPRELLDEAAQEAVAELARKRGEPPPPVMRFER